MPATAPSPHSDLPVETDVVDWLLAGDPAIAFQTRRDLLEGQGPELRSAQARIAKEGWGRSFLDARNEDGGWGERFYQPKWTSTHYTLLDLRNLAIKPDHPLVRESVHLVAITEKHPDGGIGPGVTLADSDVCVNGMFLNYAAYFGEPESELKSVVDFLIGQWMPDGGFNCRLNRSGARHSSLHSTISVLEGLHEYRSNGYKYRLTELNEIEAQCREFILLHRFFRSDHTGEVIHPSFLKFTYPPRWKYHVLRALDHFAAVGVPWDPRMADAIELIDGKRRSDGRWAGGGAHPGALHFKMEQPRQPSRWATLAALRAMRAYGRSNEHDVRTLIGNDE